MKKYTGQILFNIIVAAVGVLLFGNFIIDISSSTPIMILAAIIMMSVLTYGNYVFINNAAKGRKAFQKSYIINESTFENLVTADDYLEVMKDLKEYPQCRLEATKAVAQWEIFKKKSETLDAISSHGGVYDVVNQDIESVLLKNMMLFIRRVAIMQSSTADETSGHRKYLNEILLQNDKILNSYSNLLVEASMLSGEDSGRSEVQSLNTVIESIKKYREELEGNEK